MKDLIERQAAIDAVLGACKDTATTECAVRELEELPSAQPDLRPTCDQLATDCIGRQAAIDAVKKNTFRLTFAKEQNCEGYVAWSAEAVYSDVMEGALLELPSAQQERQKGEWIDHTEDGYVECPFCHSATNCDGNKDELHFCFSCGADMRGKQDE